MSRNFSGGFLVVVFIALAAAAALLAWPGLGDSAREERAERMRALQESMPADPRFHLAISLPDFPEEASFCNGCHPLPPHEGDGVASAFFNQHASFFDCLVCHWAKSSGEEIDLVWDRRGSAEETGRDGLVLRHGDPLEGGRKTAAELRDGLLSRQKCFDRGLACAKCHRQGGLDDYLRPELSPQRQSALERLPDFFTLSRGTKWYFPQRQ